MVNKVWVHMKSCRATGDDDDDNGDADKYIYSEWFRQFQFINVIMFIRNVTTQKQFPNRFHAY